MNGRERVYLICAIECILQDAYRCSNAVVLYFKEGICLLEFKPKIKRLKYSRR